jgi:hypothetical protein
LKFAKHLSPYKIKNLLRGTRIFYIPKLKSFIINEGKSKEKKRKEIK